MTLRAHRLTLLITVFAFAVAPFAAAVENESFGLTPQPESVDGTDRSGFSIPLEPGAVFEDAVRVYNRTDQPLELAAYASDAEAGPDGPISVGFRGTEPEGVGAWIDLSRDEVTLPPRGEIVFTFRVTVESSDPSPNLGAIVVENRASGLAADLAQREHLVVRTDPPNSPTTSMRVRPLLLRSPWIAVAMLGLLVAIVLVWVGTRRARKPKDAVTPAGETEQAKPEVEVTPEASRPVLHRLGAPENAESPLAGIGVTAATIANNQSDRRPLLEDDMLVEIEDDEDDDDIPPARHTKPAARKRTSTRRKAAPRARREAEKGYIPLDDL